jgi:type I restriction enzyme S subunit
MKSSWPTKKLGEICEKIKAGGTPSRKISRYWGGDIPFVKIEDLTSAKFYLENTQEKITEEGLENSNAWILPPNSVLFSIYASIGEVAINKVPIATNQAILGLIPKSEIVDPKFLAYSLKKFGKYLISYNIQSTQKNLTLEIVKNAEIPLPPLPIQQKIVKILDTIQEAIEIQDRIIEKTKELKKSLMAELFKYGAPSFRRGRKLKKTEIGEIPEDWEVVRLGRECEVFSGFAFSSSDFTSEGIPVIKIGNLQDGTIVLDQRTSFYPKEKLQDNKNKLSKYILKEGDVLIALTGATTGKTAVVPREFSGALLNQRVGKFNVFSNNLNLQFARYFFMSRYFQEKILESILQSAQGNVSPKQVEQVKIPLPPIPEQQEIAEILETIDQKIEIEKKKKELYEELFKTMLNKIMSQQIDINLLDY